MTNFALTHDWAQYQRTLAIRLIGNRRPEIDTHNIIVRSFVATRDVTGLLLKLRKLQMAGQIVTPYTVRYLLRFILRHRRVGKRPQVQDSRIWDALHRDDLSVAIEILRDTMISGNYVPITFWREIVKRLGMLHRMKDLQTTCEFLASWYGPSNKLLTSDPNINKRGHKYQVPSNIPTNHPLHPLRILFGPLIQGAIVEWGFINSLEKHQGLVGLTHGIDILKSLNQYGVYIYSKSVKKAIIHRLISYYGPAVSNKQLNRIQKRINPYTLTQMLEQIHRAFGRPLWSLESLQHKLIRLPIITIRKRDQKRMRLKSTRGRASAIDYLQSRRVAKELARLDKHLLKPVSEDALRQNSTNASLDSV